MRLLDAWERVRSARCRRQSLQLGVVAYARGQPHPLVIVGAARPCQCVLLVLLGQVGNAACSPNKATFDAGRALDMRWLLALLDARRRRLGGGAELLTLDWAQAGNDNAVQLDARLAARRTTAQSS